MRSRRSCTTKEPQEAAWRLCRRWEGHRHKADEVQSQHLTLPRSGKDAANPGSGRCQQEKAASTCPGQVPVAPPNPQVSGRAGTKVRPETRVCSREGGGPRCVQGPALASGRTGGASCRKGDTHAHREVAERSIGGTCLWGGVLEARASQAGRIRRCLVPGP